MKITLKLLIDEINEKYPLFRCEVRGDELIQVFMGRSCSTYCNELNERNIPTFDHEHKRLEVSKKLEEKYPYLIFYVGSDYKPHSIWVKREDRGAEAISYIIQDDPPYMQDIMLQHYNLEAKKANEPGYFFCSGCNEAKLQSEYAFFHFAGNYCKECKDADPEAYQSAINENYN